MTNSPIDYAKHPCFNAKVKGQFGRVHLPVAPKCNIKCNYCDRKYDCVNESRPGVTSTVLSPEQAGVYMEKVLEKEPRITVAGIAGPGDPFANGEETMETLRLIRQKFPQTILCLASNGLAIGPYIEELATMNVSHVTITINAVDPAIGEKIYAWVRDGKILHRGRAAAELLLAASAPISSGLYQRLQLQRSDQLRHGSGIRAVRNIRHSDRPYGNRHLCGADVSGRSSGNKPATTAESPVCPFLHRSGNVRLFGLPGAYFIFCHQGGLHILHPDVCRQCCRNLHGLSGPPPTVASRFQSRHIFWPFSVTACCGRYRSFFPGFVWRGLCSLCRQKIGYDRGLY